MGNESGSSVGRLCGGIMSAATMLALLAFLAGAVACRVGFFNRLVAVLLLDSWLLWPLGALCCGAVVLCAWLKERERRESSREVMGQ